MNDCSFNYPNTFFVKVLPALLAVLMLFAWGTPAVAIAAPTSAKPALMKVDFSQLPGNKFQAKFTFNQAVKAPKSFVMRDPNRILLDFPGVENHLKQTTQRTDVGPIIQSTVVAAGNRTRAIIELNEPLPYQVRLAGNVVYLTMDANQILDKSANKSDIGQEKKLPVQRHSIKNIDFRMGQKNTGRVIITLSDPNVGVDVTQQGGDVKVDFLNTLLPQRLQRRLDVTDFGTPVTTINTLMRSGDTKMLIAASGNYEHLAYQTGDKFIIDIKPMTEEDQLLARQLAEPRYSGKRLSLDFQDIKVRAVLQLLADFTGINMVVSDAVSGNITLRLNDVPWDQALDIILKTQGLAQRKVGNVMLVAPLEEIAAREKRELESTQQVAELAPLHSELLQVNYAKAQDIANLLKTKDTSLLSDRGTVSVDSRTNTLWVRDTTPKLREIRGLIHRLDIPVKQVLIESRIVIVDKKFEKDLGIKWGITSGHLSGTLEGANTIQKNGGDPLSVDFVKNRLNVNLPAVPTTGVDPASLGIAVAKLGSDTFLDLELSALESEGGGETLSAPRLVTANGKEAYIEQGDEIPFEEQTSSGATSVSFKKAVLSLRVTPQITPDNKIIMNLKVNNDKPGEEVKGVPSIITREIETQVLVDNGETIVLGGIYEKSNTRQVQRIPFLGSLPWIGYLFRNTSVNTEQKELLIFITPRIIEQGFITST